MSEMTKSERINLMKNCLARVDAANGFKPVIDLRKIKVKEGGEEPMAEICPLTAQDVAEETERLAGYRYQEREDGNEENAAFEDNNG